jgi:hypothetical protein
VSADVIALPVRPDRQELARLRAIEAAARDFVGHVEGRGRCGEQTVRIAAVQALRDAVRGTPDGAA